MTMSMELYYISKLSHFPRTIWQFAPDTLKLCISLENNTSNYAVMSKCITKYELLIYCICYL